MAQADYSLTGDPDVFVAFLDRRIEQGSATAQVEARAEHAIGEARMLVRTYERFSATGGNRLTLTVTVLAVGDRMELSAIASGGSQGMFLKINTFGEQAFLDKADDAIEAFRALSART